ncbi:MAG: UDPGP type 1 family protein [Planctomycetota bacterium]
MPATDTLRDQLQQIGQEHLLAFEDRLSGDEREALRAQLTSIELAIVPELVERYVRRDEAHELPSDLAPAPYYPSDPASETRPWDTAAMRASGESLIAAGNVACFTVAGGQGSRLGFEGPKGCYPTGCISSKPLFEIFAEGILASQNRYGARIPWYIMTSPLNHEATVAFFREHDHFGLNAGDVMFFEQGVLPSFDKQTGKMLLAEPGLVATNPDGHGGSVRALKVSGALDDMKARGVTQISYFQVDNPHVKVVDPVFLGLHASAPDSSGEVSSKMLSKAAWDEKVGVFCRDGARTTVIEYSDMPDELAQAQHPGGALRFNAGSIAIHVLSVAFVDKLASDPAFQLPYHRAIKKVAHVDINSGNKVEPSEPNAVKLERFVFDALPLAEGSIVYETDRVEEFAPVKNKTGTDSIETSKALQTERAARWLEACGTTVPRTSDGAVDAVIEISALTALDPEQLKASGPPESIEPGSSVTL